MAGASGMKQLSRKCGMLVSCRTRRGRYRWLELKHLAAVEGMDGGIWRQTRGLLESSHRWSFIYLGLGVRMGYLVDRHGTVVLILMLESCMEGNYVMYRYAMQLCNIGASLQHFEFFLWTTPEEGDNCSNSLARPPSVCKLLPALYPGRQTTTHPRVPNSSISSHQLQHTEVRLSLSASQLFPQTLSDPRCGRLICPSE